MIQYEDCIIIRICPTDKAKGVKLGLIEERKEAILGCPDGGTTLLPQGPMCMRTLINPKLREKMSDPNVDLSKEYSLQNVGKAWTTGDFDLFPAGGGMVSALITESRPVKTIIEEMVS